MSATTSYTLCLRRKGNRNKGLPAYITQLALSGAQQTALTASGMVIDARGIITVLGTSNTSLSVADAAYIANPIEANRPIQRKLVAALPVAIAAFTVNTGAAFDGDGTWRLQKFLQTMNEACEQMEPFVQASQDALSMLNTIKGVTITAPALSGTFGYGGVTTTADYRANDRLYKLYFVNQLSGNILNSGDGGMNGGKSTSRYEYFITNK
jgi:hypothetical protein